MLQTLASVSSRKELGRFALPRFRVRLMAVVLKRLADKSVRPT